MTEKISLTKNIRKHPGRTALAALGLGIAGLTAGQAISGGNSGPERVTAAASGDAGTPAPESPTTSTTVAAVAPEVAETTVPVVTTPPETIRVAPPTTASTAPVAEKPVARPEQSQQALAAYGNDLLERNIRGERPLARAACGVVYEFKSKANGEVITVDNAVIANRFTATQNPQAETSPANQAYLRFVSEKLPNGDLKKNSAGITIRHTEVYDARTHYITAKPLPNAPSKECVVELDPPGGEYGDVDVIGRIVTPASDLRISVGGVTYAEPTVTDPNAPTPEIQHGSLPPENPPAPGPA